MIQKYIFPNGDTHLLILNESKKHFNGMEESSVNVMNSEYILISSSRLGTMKLSNSNDTLITNCMFDGDFNKIGSQYYNKPALEITHSANYTSFNNNRRL